jgi:hypothetical protein
MRHLVVVASLLLVPGAAIAQSSQPPTLSEAIQAPGDALARGDYYVLAIAAGAVVGVAVASSLSGGIVMPIVGGVVGGYVGDWVYRQ